MKYFWEGFEKRAGMDPSMHFGAANPMAQARYNPAHSVAAGGVPGASLADKAKGVMSKVKSGIGNVASKIIRR